MRKKNLNGFHYNIIGGLSVAEGASGLVVAPVVGARRDGVGAMPRRLDAVDAAARDCDAVDAAARAPTRPAQVSHNQLKVMAPCKIAQSADQDKQEGIGEPDLNGCD